MTTIPGTVEERADVEFIDTPCVLDHCQWRYSVPADEAATAAQAANTRAMLLRHAHADHSMTEFLTEIRALREDRDRLAGPVLDTLTGMVERVVVLGGQPWLVVLGGDRDDGIEEVARALVAACDATVVLLPAGRTLDALDNGALAAMGLVRGNDDESNVRERVARQIEEAAKHAPFGRADRPVMRAAAAIARGEEIS